MLLLLKLMLTVGKGARISILTLLVLYPALAELSLDLELVVVGDNSTVASESEWILSWLLVFMRDPSLFNEIVLEELVLVLQLVLDAPDLIVEIDLFTVIVFYWLLIVYIIKTLIILIDWKWVHLLASIWSRDLLLNQHWLTILFNRRLLLKHSDFGQDILRDLNTNIGVLQFRVFTWRFGTY